MKNILLFILLTSTICAKAQPPGYYNAAYGQSGESLRAALALIIRPHNALNYGGNVLPNTWESFKTTDVRPDDGKVWDIYSDRPGSTPPYEYDFGQRCGNGSGHENSCYNHEHVWPQSKFNAQLPMRSDLWIVYPTDYYVNGQRSDWPYGEVNSPSKTFMNGSRLGPNSTSGAPTGTAFEPIDSFKGDVARSYFYIAACYRNDSSDFEDWEMADNVRLKPWAVQMLLRWHHDDPVSAKERVRNEAAYAIQGNRNPFIDEPQFADCIWAGNCNGLSVVPSLQLPLQISPNPARDQVQLSWSRSKKSEALDLCVFDLCGRMMWHQRMEGQTQVKLELSTWPRGLYFLQLKSARGSSFQRFVLE